MDNYFIFNEACGKQAIIREKCIVYIREFDKVKDAVSKLPKKTRTIIVLDNGSAVPLLNTINEIKATIPECLEIRKN